MDTNKLPDCPALVKTPLDLQAVTLMLEQELATQESLAECLLGIEAMIEMLLVSKTEELPHEKAQIFEYCRVISNAVANAQKLNDDSLLRLGRVGQQ
jgi:hypothetical protein